MKQSNLARLLLGGSLTLLLAACGQSNPPAAEADPYAGGASSPWAYTAPGDELMALSLTPGENALSSEPLLSARNGWGPVEIDRSNGGQGAGDGRTLTINGKTYSRGFGVHAGSELRFSLAGAGATCTRFTAEVGVDDEVGPRGKVVFQVYLDGAKAYDSGVMKGKDPARRVDLDITGKQDLRLVVTDAGNGIKYDHANWAGPKVLCKAVQTPAGPSGSLDSSFGAGGRADVGGRDAVLAPDGAVLIADTINGDFALKRLLPSGSVQQVITDFGGQDAAYALARQADGKVVVVGQSNNNFAAARYNPDLSLDTSFGRGGKVVTDLGSLSLEAAYAVAVQPDGKIVAAGTTIQPVPAGTPESRDFALVRYNANGQPDPTFGANGVVVTRFDSLIFSGYGYTEDTAHAVALQPDGKIVVAGGYSNGGGREGLLARYNANGSLDTTLAGSGFVRTNAYGSYTNLNDVALMADGSIVAVGSSNRYFGDGLVLRFNPNATSASSTVIHFTGTSMGDQSVLSDVLVQPDGKVLVGGLAGSYSGTARTIQYALARLNPDLTLDTAFGTSGQVLTGLDPVLVAELGEIETPLGALLQQPDGKIVVLSAKTARYWP